MTKLVSYFFSEYNFSNQALRFKQFLYLFLIIKAFYWLSYYDLYFGQNALAYSEIYSLGPLKDVAFFLYNSKLVYSGYYFITGVFLFLLISYFIKRIPFVFEFVLWLLVINIHNKIYLTLTGGDYLLNQFLFFNCFIAKSYQNNLSWQSSLSKCFHNFGVIAIIIQIQLVYVIAGLAKINNSDWINGAAIIKLDPVEHYHMFCNLHLTNNFLGYVINYLVLFYQLLFPILIWINKLKKPFLVIGILTHLYIAFVIGIVGFGLIMLLAYIFFWPNKKTLNNFH